ncbi:Conserved_hypothetical protein [Hexamita inflata]|uniref:Uncharacterized protein n=1 Tax=Hexamita inflata TaxID=28002 RepID=A0AA86NP15_9EUKA|nr:Conserved hypothetical protein [Hexamita inflata]
MTLLLSSELTSHDFDTNYSICWAGCRIIVYFDQQPINQIDSEFQICAATVYEDKVYFVENRISDCFLVVHDAQLGAQIQTFELNSTDPSFSQFLYQDQLYLVQYKNNMDFLILTRVLTESVERMQLKFQAPDSTPFTMQVSADVDFAFFEDILLLFSQNSSLLLQWKMITNKSELHLQSDPQKLPDTLFLYQNNGPYYQLYTNNFEFYDSSMEKQKSGSFFEVVKYKNTFTLIRDQQKLTFNSKQLLLQYLSSKNIPWTQEVTKIVATELNAYDQQIVSQKHENNLLTIQIQFLTQKKIFIYECQQQAKVCGFMFIHKDKLIVALDTDNKTKIVVLGQETDVEPQILSTFKKCSKVDFQFDQMNPEIFNLNQILYSVQYDNYSTIQTPDSEIIRVKGKIIDFSARENQICYITETAIGIIEDQQSIFQMPLINAKSCYSASKNCFLFLTKDKLNLVIYQDHKIYQYYEDVTKYVSKQIRFIDGYIELYGSQTFQLQTNASYLIQLYMQLSKNEDRAVIQRVINNINEADFDAYVFIKLIDARKDKEQILKYLLSKFKHNERLLFYAINFVNQKDFLLQIYELIKRANVHKQFELFMKIISKIDRSNYKTSYKQLKTNNQYEQLDSNYINYILHKSLIENPLIFVLYSKTLNMSDSDIVEQLDLHKNDLLKEMNEKQVFVYARQCLQQTQSNSTNIIVSSTTKQEQFMSLIQTIFHIYGLNPISGQFVQEGQQIETKNKFQKIQLDANYKMQQSKYYYLKSQVFGAQNKNYSVQEVNIMRYLPVYKLPVISTSQSEVKVDAFLPETAVTLQKADWDDEEQSKKKKVKKFAIKTKDLASVSLDSAKGLDFMQSLNQFAKPALQQFNLNTFDLNKKQQINFPPIIISQNPITSAPQADPFDLIGQTAVVSQTTTIKSNQAPTSAPQNAFDAFNSLIPSQPQSNVPQFDPFATSSLPEPTVMFNEQQNESFPLQNNDVPLQNGEWTEQNWGNNWDKKKGDALLEYDPW